MQAEQAAQSLDDIIMRTIAGGADAADARISTHSSMSVEVRSGELSSLEHEEGQGIALRAMVGHRQAHVAGSDLSESGLNALIERVCAMAKNTPEDPWCGLAGADEMVYEHQDLELKGDPSPSFDKLQDFACRAGDSALSVEGVQQTDHVGAGWGYSETFMAASNGFRGMRCGGMLSASVVAIAGEGDGMERDYEVCSVRKLSDMPEPEEIGLIAGERAVKRLSPRKPASDTVPVIFHRRLSASLLKSFIGAIAGPSIARGVSFLQDRLGEKVFSSDINIIDDPLRKGGYGSRAFDGEGREVRKQALIDKGVLTQWLLSGPSARQLGLQPNGFSSAGFGDPPGVSVSNLDLLPGSRSIDQLLSDAGRGMMVTDMFGPSVNPDTGDYSVGVSGFWFDKGEICYPVNEVTIAGDLPSMFNRLIAGNDLEIRDSINAPSLLVDAMALGGS